MGCDFKQTFNFKQIKNHKLLVIIITDQSKQIISDYY